MNTTAKTLVGWIAGTILFSATVAVAGLWDGTSRAWLGTTIVGQSTSADNTSDASKGKQTTDLLRRARQAMGENDYAAADSLIAQAEALGVQYNALYMGDTPKKARRDLDRKRNTSGAATKPSQLFAPLGLNKNKKSPASDPFAGQTPDLATGTTNVNVGKVMPLPKVDAAVPVQSLTAQNAPPPPPMTDDPAYRLLLPGDNDARSPGALGNKPMAAAAPAGNTAPTVKQPSPLRLARLALAVGDVRRAAAMAEQAKTTPTADQPANDSAEKAEADIRKYQELSNLDKNTEAYRRDNRRAEYGDERNPKMRAVFEKISPMVNIQKIGKPMLVMQGANDPRVPQSESDQVVAKLREAGVETWYVLFADEGHGFLKKHNNDLRREVETVFLRKLFEGK